MVIITNLFNCTQEQFNKHKSLDLISINCALCNKSFLKTKKEIINKHNKTGSMPKFCSIVCHGKDKTLKGRRLVKCTNCNKEFYKDLCAVSEKNFCTKSCAATFNNKNKTHGTKRSKLEVYLENRLQELYPNLDFIFNGKEEINSELDIYIPSLKLAFELNGIFHYEPIFGNDKLNQIQNNDSNKFQKCQEKGISLCIIDTSSQKRFTEQSSQKFLDIISKIIERTA